VPLKTEAALLFVVDRNRTGSAFVNHAEILQEGSADERQMGLPTSCEVHGCECPVKNVGQERDMDLCEVDVHDVSSADSSDPPAVYYGQIELCSQPAIDATLCRPGINESPNTSDSRDGYLEWDLWIEVRVEPDVN
jgi:hypothetical protein